MIFYYLQLDGMVECFNWILIMMFSVFVNEYYFDWDVYLLYVMMVY